MSEFKEELKRSPWLVRPKWEKPVEVVIPWQPTDEEGKAAVLEFFEQHPGADTSDAADTLRLPIKRAFDFTDALVAEGKLSEVPDWDDIPPGDTA